MDVEASVSPPGSPPAGGPLQMTSPDRVNRCEPPSTPRESTVHDKISQFNNMSVSMQSRHLERKTADAALKRALVGREEAEGETRRLREESRSLRKAIDEGKERERRVGERLETVMENYGRAKETHAHTQALWEKEIRRSRKENFKAQSSIVKLQEELKSARGTIKSLQDGVTREKERSHNREQEAFTSRIQMVSLQEQLDKALDQIKLVEQERDAYRAAAKTEEIARIAAEGRIPLPAAEDPADEFASPPKKKTKRQSTIVRDRNPRVSLTTMEIVSSAASELEIEELTEQVQWEKQRADRAQEMIEFMQAECLMHCCPCSKSKRRTSLLATQGGASRSSSSVVASQPPVEEATGEPGEDDAQDEPAGSRRDQKPVRSKKEPRLSTIFFPKEGIFRTVSEHDAIALEAKQEAESVSREPMDVELDVPVPRGETETNPRVFARTPSAEPPIFAFHGHGRTSLLSLIDAPRGDALADAVPVTYSIPTVPDTELVQPKEEDRDAMDEDHLESQSYKQSGAQQTEPRPETTASSIQTLTTTTLVPLRDSGSSTNSFFSHKLRTPSTGSNASFNLKDPAMTPTMTREEALAKIRERRGRTNSAGRSASGPRLKSKELERRDASESSEKAARGLKRPRMS